jgi:hypothetical protein
MERNNKNQGQTRNWNQTNYKKNWWNRKLVLWKDYQDKQTISQHNKMEEGEDPN